MNTQDHDSSSLVAQDSSSATPTEESETPVLSTSNSTRAPLSLSMPLQLLGGFQLPVTVPPKGKSHKHCCAPICKSDSRYDTENKSFHRFPKDDDLRKLWLAEIKREADFKVTDNMMVCSDHFEKGDIIKKWGGKRELRKGAIPTKFDWTKSVQRRKAGADMSLHFPPGAFAASTAVFPSTSSPEDDSVSAPTTDQDSEPAIMSKLADSNPGSPPAIKPAVKRRRLLPPSTQTQWSQMTPSKESAAVPDNSWSRAESASRFEEDLSLPTGSEDGKYHSAAAAADSSGWTRCAIETLCSIHIPKLAEYNNSGKAVKRRHWQQVMNSLANHGFAGEAFNSTDKISAKWRNLYSQYKKVKATNDKHGRNKTRFCYFDMMNRLFVENNVTNVVSSSSSSAAPAAVATDPRSPEYGSVAMVAGKPAPACCNAHSEQMIQLAKAFYDRSLRIMEETRELEWQKVELLKILRDSSNK